MGIYLICPVRKLEDEEKELLDAYVSRIRKRGEKIKCPYEDTDQDDEVGLRIVNEHENDILENEFVHVWWNPKSRGSLWDIAQSKLAAYFDKTKQIFFLNKDPDPLKFDYVISDRPGIDLTKSKFSIVWKDDNKEELSKTLWKMGQARMLKRFKPEIEIKLANIKQLTLDPHKSYKNVAIATDIGLETCDTREELRQKLEERKRN